MADAEQLGTTQGAKIRHDWYQTETHVIVNILHRNAKETDLNVEFGSDSLNISFPLESGERYNLNLNLAYEVVPSECTYKVLPSKIEVKLKKKNGFRWVNLEGDANAREFVKTFPCGEPTVQNEVAASAKQNTEKKSKDWDKVVNDITNSDEFKPEAEEALNALFQKIYSEGSDEVRKAMNKSFIESNGTVLSTNWEEVKHDKVDVKPPDGMEWKKWDQ